MKSSENTGADWQTKLDKRNDLFAATPPLEAKKMLLSYAVTAGIGYLPGEGEEGMKLDFIDTSRAYFQADVVREVYVELPLEKLGRGNVWQTQGILAWDKRCCPELG